MIRSAALATKLTLSSQPASQPASQPVPQPVSVPRESPRSATVLAFGTAVPPGGAARPGTRLPFARQPVSGMPAARPAMMEPMQAAPVVRLPIIDQPVSPSLVAEAPAGTQAFASAEQAWFWTIGALRARREGGGAGGGRKVARPCEPDDVLRCLDTLYRRRRIDLVHARILRIWGERGRAPNPAYARERGDWRVWREAIERLEWPLRVKGIVA